MNIHELFDILAKKEMFLRLENDEQGFYLSIIDREKYPRAWADNYQSQQSFIMTETVDHLISRTVLSECDWMARFEGMTIDEVVDDCENWLTCHNLL